MKRLGKMLSLFFNYWENIGKHPLPKRILLYFKGNPPFLLYQYNAISAGTGLFAYQNFEKMYLLTTLISHFKADDQHRKSAVL